LKLYDDIARARRAIFLSRKFAATEVDLFPGFVPCALAMELSI
jgi:hypothetical protein